MVSIRFVLGVASLFWIVGAFATGFTAFKAFIQIAPYCKDKPKDDVNDKWSWVAFGTSVAFAFLVLIPCLLLPLAKREVQRIRALKKPRWYNFFHGWRLLAFCIIMPANVVIFQHTQKYFIACMVIGSLCLAASLGMAYALILYILPSFCGTSWNCLGGRDSDCMDLNMEDCESMGAEATSVNDDSDDETLIKYSPQQR